MPPASLHSSNAMRIEAAAFAPCTAVTPDRSVIIPMMISVSETPRWAACARPSKAGAQSKPAAPASTDRRVVACVLVIDKSLPVAAGPCPVRRVCLEPRFVGAGVTQRVSLWSNSAVGEIDRLRPGTLAERLNRVTAIRPLLRPRAARALTRVCPPRRIAGNSVPAGDRQRPWTTIAGGPRSLVPGRAGRERQDPVQGIRMTQTDAAAPRTVAPPHDRRTRAGQAPTQRPELFPCTKAEIPLEEHNANIQGA